MEGAELTAAAAAQLSGPETPATPPVDGAAPATPPIDNATPQTPLTAPTDDVNAELDSLLAQESAADPNAALEQLKDNPRVQELLGLETAVAQAMQDSQYVTEPAHLANAVADASALWSIMDGKASAVALLETMRTSAPAVFQKAIPELADYIQKVTGQPIARNAAGGEAPPDPATIADPAMREIAELKSYLHQQRQVEAQRQQSEQESVFAQRFTQAGEKLNGRLGELLKDKWIPEAAPRFMSRIADAFAGKEAQLVEQIERGDYRAVDRVVKKAQTDELQYVRDVNKWLIERKRANLSVVPRQPAGGAPPVMPGEKIDFSDPKELTKAAVRALTS